MPKWTDDTYPDVPLSQAERRSLYEEILENSPVQFIGDGPPVVEVSNAMADKLAKMAKEFGTTDQRLYEAACIAWLSQDEGEQQ